MGQPKHVLGGSARVGRIVVDVDHETGLVGELLQFEFPEPALKSSCEASACSTMEAKPSLVSARRHATEAIHMLTGESFTRERNG